MKRVRNLVIGAGAAGSAAAYHLARRGEPVLLLEQFALGHNRGSSHGAARITRHSYADPAYARLMPRAFAAWRAFEAAAGETVYHRTGGVSLCPAGVDYVERVAANLAELDVPHTRLTSAQLAARYPQFGLAPGHEIVFEPDAGLLAAARVVALQVELAEAHGAEVRACCPVQAIDLSGEQPVVLTGEAPIAAERLIVAAGAWTRVLLPSLQTPLVPTRQQVAYLAPADRSAYALGRFPVWIFQGAAADQAYYGMPDFLAGGVKAARHFGPPCDPDSVDRTRVEPEAIGLLRGFLAQVLPDLAGAPIERTEICLYTEAPGDQFQVGPFPGRDDVLVASPCSGHGFKFAQLVGQVLADLATRGASDVALGVLPS